MQTKLKPEVKEMWVEALRSGEYKQTQHELHNEDGYCCLGVLTDLYVRSHPELNEEEQEDVWNGDMEAAGEYNVLPNPKVMEWAIDNYTYRIHGQNRVWRAGGAGSDTLYAMNDAGTTFEEIAEVIDYHF